jgi:cytoskeletal protein RodZ
MAATYDEINWIGVGSVVRDRRSASGLSHEDAAQKLCLSKKQILALENGSSAPFPGALVRSWCGRRYAVLLGLDWERLVQPPPGDDQSVVTENILASALPLAPAPVPETGRERPGSHMLLSGAILLLMVVIAIEMTVNDSSAPVSPPAAEVAPKVISHAVVFSSVDIAPVEPSAPPADRQAAAKGEATVVANPAKIANQTQTSAAAAKAAVETVFEIQGKDPAKRVGSFFVSSKEQAALLKKKRNDPGEGVRIELAQGAELLIPISPSEIFRVAEGRNLEIFYQGRMVPAQIVESGAWVNLVRKTSDTRMSDTSD